MKYKHSPNRRFRRFPRKNGTFRASDHLGATLANLYFRLASGTRAQQGRAQELKALVLDMGRMVS